MDGSATKHFILLSDPQSSLRVRPGWDVWAERLWTRRDSPVASELTRTIRIHPISALTGTEPLLTKPPSVTASIEAVCFPSIDGSNQFPAEKLSELLRCPFGACRKKQFHKPANRGVLTPR